MGMVHAVQKGALSPSDVSDKVKDAADQMDDSDAEDYASTKHSGKPEHVPKEVVGVARKLREMIRQIVKENPTFLLKKEAAKRDYKAEYKKFQSSDKAKKYRAELNQYNRKKGTYGNGDGKDASHKGGKIVGFESQSKNRGRAEKSRLKKEAVNEDGHTDVASAERKLKLIVKDAMDTINQLRNMSNEDSLPSWWTDKITLAKDYVSKSRDYITNPAESFEEGFGGDLKGEEKMKFEKARKANGEQLGYKLSGTSDIKESVNENAQKVAKLLIKRGNKPNRVKDMVKKHYKKAKKDRSKAGPSDLASYISFLSANESVNEKTVSIGGEELLKFLMKRFKMSKSQAIASMKKHKMDMSFLKKESVSEGRKWSMHVDGKKIKTYTSKRAAVIAHNKFMKDTDNWKEVSIQAESVSEIFPKGAGRKISKAMQKENYKPEKRRKLKTGEVEVMKGKGSRQKWFYLKNKEEVKQLIKLGRNSAFPTGITNNNSRVKFDKGLHIKESVNERKLSSLQKKAMSIAIEMSGNMTGAVKKIEKLKRGLSKDKKVVNALKVSNESVNESVNKAGMELGKVFTGHGKSFVKEIFPKGAGRKISKAMQKGIEPQGNIKKVLDVAKNQQSKKIGGTLVDLTTANLMTQVWNKVNDSSKEKMNKMNAKQLTNLILRIWKGVGTPRV